MYSDPAVFRVYFRVYFDVPRVYSTVFQGTSFFGARHPPIVLWPLAYFSSAKYSTVWNQDLALQQRISSCCWMVMVRGCAGFLGSPFFVFSLIPF